jgi:hypothetical protein
LRRLTDATAGSDWSRIGRLTELPILSGFPADHVAMATAAPITIAQTTNQPNGVNAMNQLWP